MFFLSHEATERATISQVINSRHSSFLTVNQVTNTSTSAGWASWTIFQSPEATYCAISYRAHSLSPLLRSELTFPFFSLADEVSFFWLCNPAWLARDSKMQPMKIIQFFGTGTWYGKVKKEKKTIFDSEEYERNAFPKLRRLLTTSSRVIKTIKKCRYSIVVFTLEPK